jgi:hypothetical protein
MPVGLLELEDLQPSSDSSTPLGEPTPLPFSWLVFVFAAASLLLHFLGRERYGFFRDELYYNRMWKPSGVWICRSATLGGPRSKGELDTIRPHDIWFSFFPGARISGVSVAYRSDDA